MEDVPDADLTAFVKRTIAVTETIMRARTAINDKNNDGTFIKKQSVERVSRRCHS